MISKRFLFATAVLLVAALPVLAQRGGNFYRGGNTYRGGSSFGFGVTLGSPVSGLGFTYGSGPYGNFYGGGYRPYYGGGYRPYYGGGYGSFYNPGLVIPQTYIVPRTYVVPQTYYVPQATTVVPVQPAPATETGLVITELKAQGTAKAAGLRQGDVILAVDGQRIQTYDALRAALTTTGKKSAVVEFIDGSNNQIDKKDVAVIDGKMGITIEEVPLKRD